MVGEEGSFMGMLCVSWMVNHRVCQCLPKEVEVTKRVNKGL